jgi:hypothetical protein
MTGKHTNTFLKAFSRPFFGILLGLLPLLVLWNFNTSQMHTRDVWFALLVTLGFVSIISTVFLLIFKNKLKANLGLTAFFVVFFSYGHVYNLIAKTGIFGHQIGYVKLFLAYFVLFAALLVLITLLKIKMSRSSTAILNGVVIFLCLLNLTSILVYNANLKSAKTAAVQPATTPAVTENSSGQPLANIYYIVLDAYSRQDVLAKLMNYDNSAFINALKERGFYVVDCANSNYGATVSSMASSLNYSYLDSKLDDPNNINLTQYLINNKVRADLKNYGYQFVTTRGFSSENDIPNSDIYLDYMKNKSSQYKIERDQFTRLYYETSLLRIFVELYNQDPVRYSWIPNWLILADQSDGVLGYATYWYNQTRYVFDTLPEFATKPGRYFVYAHINLPHGPYVFDADGNFKYVYNPTDNIPYYTEAVTYANKRALQLIDSLIANSAVPPIIILQGDHAAHEITSGFDKNKILEAYYFPADVQKDLYNTITPVNTFRLVLRDYFHQQIDLLPDQVYGKELNNYEFRPSSCDTSVK